MTAALPLPAQSTTSTQGAGGVAPKWPTLPLVLRVSALQSPKAPTTIGSAGAAAAIAGHVAVGSPISWGV